MNETQGLPPGDPFLDAGINASRVLTGIAVRSMSLTVPEASLPAWRALWALNDRGPMRPSQLASALDMSAATGTRVAAKLHREGLAERYTDPNDRRNVLFAITDKGYSTLAAAVSKQRALYARAFAELSVQQKKELACAFEALYAAAKDTGVLWP